MNFLSKMQSEQTAEVQTVPEASEAPKSHPEGNDPKTARKRRTAASKTRLRSKSKRTHDRIQQQ